MYGSHPWRKIFFEDAGIVFSLTKVEYVLQIYWKYTFKVYLKYTPSICTLNILQCIKLKKEKYISSLYNFNKRIHFETHFVKLNCHFQALSGDFQHACDKMHREGIMPICIVFLKNLGQMLLYFTLLTCSNIYNL